jgi:hypothetical protein
MTGAKVATLRVSPALSPAVLYQQTEQLSGEALGHKKGLENVLKSSWLQRRQSSVLPSNKRGRTSINCKGSAFGTGGRKSNGKARRQPISASTVIAPEVSAPQGQDYVRRGGPDADLVAKQAKKKLNQPRIADTVSNLSHIMHHSTPENVHNRCQWW